MPVSELSVAVLPKDLPRFERHGDNGVARNDADRVVAQRPVVRRRGGEDETVGCADELSVTLHRRAERRLRGVFGLGIHLDAHVLGRDFAEKQRHPDQIMVVAYLDMGVANVHCIPEGLQVVAPAEDLRADRAIARDALLE